ncbi:TraG [Klebsiella pneumoniae subsp. ozaenae]|uniref:TraG n=1 Tax=Klebsiella pneumoniae subsp. ozaenae TaxID=574 RepID=A0A378UC55_KLEPO|nr:TraG [Klebsiella pneumoniae subsp. ozaenae]
MQTFNEGMDVLRNYSVTYNGAHVDNAASGLLNQISAGVNTSDSHYQQYTTSLARTHEYQQMASQTDTMSAQVRGNYNQEFVEWVKTRMPASEWQPIVADTGNPELRERREQLAEAFMEDKLRSRVEGHYDQSAIHVGDNISSPRNVAGEQYGNAYRANSAEIDQRGHDAGIRHDVKQDVKRHVDTTQKNMDDTEDVVNIDKNQMTKSRG